MVGGIAADNHATTSWHEPRMPRGADMSPAAPALPVLPSYASGPSDVPLPRLAAFTAEMLGDLPGKDQRAKGELFARR